MHHAADATLLYTVAVSLMLGLGFSVQGLVAEIKAEPSGNTRSSVQTKRLAMWIKVTKDQI